MSIPTHIASILRETQNIRKEITRLSAHIKALRLAKSRLEPILFDYMEEKNMTKIANITIASVRPKNKRKPIKEKKQDAYQLFYSEGIEDPESFYKKFLSTQKYIQQNKRDDLQ